jgi:hypothetical protein
MPSTTHYLGEDIICYCKEPEEPVDWMSFLYGGLAGLGAVTLLAVSWKLLCGRKSQRSSGFEIGMSDYVNDEM